MSSAGIPQNGLANILALARPDIAAQQQALATRRAFAESLLGNQPEYGGPGGAANNFGSKILGAILERNANKQALDIAQQQRQALFGQAPGLAPQTAPAGPPLGSMPQGGIVPLVPQASTQAALRPPLATMPQTGMVAPPAPQPPPQAPVVQLPPSPPAMAAPQGGQSLFDQAVPDIPGIDPRKKFALYASDPAGYMKTYYASQAQPDAVKTATFAFGGNTAGAQQSLQDAARKGGTIDLRDMGSAMVPDGTNADGSPRYKRYYGPNEALNEQFTENPDGTMRATPIEGGSEAAAAFRGKVKGAEEENTILPEVTLPDGRRVPMYAGAAIGGAPAGGAASNITANNPINVQKNGADIRYATPTAGLGKAWEVLSDYSKQGVNTVNSIVKKWAPYAPPEYAANVASTLKVDGNQPLNIDDPNVKGLLIDAMRPNETGNRYQAPQNSLPQLGVSTAQNEVNKAAGEAAASSGHVQGSSDALLKAIDGMIAINDQVPDSTFLGPETKAAINERAPNLPGFRGDAGALQQWEQMNSIGILGGIKNLGMGRTDIPIVKQVVAGGGIPASIPAADRMRLLQTLKTEVMNNRAAAQNIAANLNAPGAATPPTTTMQTYPTNRQQAVPPPNQRQVNQIYQTPKGPMKWVGNGWLPQ